MPPLDDAALDRLFRTARTFNGYTDEAVTEADIRAIYDLVKMGPTSANQQPARWVWLLSGEGKERLAQAASANNGPKIRAAPAAVIWVMMLSMLAWITARSEVVVLVVRVNPRMLSPFQVVESGPVPPEL